VQKLDAAIAASNQNAYQTAFQFLQGRRGQKAANEIIKRAVWRSRRRVAAAVDYVPSDKTTDEVCRALDTDLAGWELAPAVHAVGALIAGYPERFGQTVLTTNFDPLLEVSIARAGSPHFRTVLHRDGNLSQTEGDGCHVIHLHGYWHGSDTLHTARQLNQPRPRLKASLAYLIKGKTLVVSGYGGWDDTFTEALMDVVNDDTAYPEIIWTFNSEQPELSENLSRKLAPGLDRGRVTLYSGIDCHDFFPKLQQAWNSLEPPLAPRYTPSYSHRMRFLVGEMPQETVVTSMVPKSRRTKVLEGNEEDRPPLIEFCVGREHELAKLAASDEKICFIHGLGGQGKSTLAAQYFSNVQKSEKFDLVVWRDCKEEDERLEAHIVRIIERLSNGLVLGKDIANNKIDVLTEILIHHAREQCILFVFDNIDHYIDLEGHRLAGVADAFLEKFLRLQSNCKIVFTCRPLIQYSDLPILSLKLEGLGLPAAIELFSNRGGQLPARGN
jgi:hypothetical protein